jgi:hypothetical protein
LTFDQRLRICRNSSFLSHCFGNARPSKVHPFAAYLPVKRYCRLYFRWGRRLLFLRLIRRIACSRLRRPYGEESRIRLRSAWVDGHRCTCHSRKSTSLYLAKTPIAMLTSVVSREMHLHPRLARFAPPQQFYIHPLRHLVGMHILRGSNSLHHCQRDTCIPGPGISYRCLSWHDYDVPAYGMHVVVRQLDRRTKEPDTKVVSHGVLLSLRVFVGHVSHNLWNIRLHCGDHQIVQRSGRFCCMVVRR